MYLDFHKIPDTNDANGLRKGITTGSCAAAAAKAAVLAEIMGEYYEKVTIHTPEGKDLLIPIAGYGFKGDHKNSAWVRKDAGDDCDFTHGVLIGAQINTDQGHDNSIRVLGGRGVGKITKPGLPLAVGEAAINPVPSQMIKENVKDILPKGLGVDITIVVPAGKEIAKKTLNAKLGIVDGISILGTTGIVEPMSEEALKDSLKLQLDQMKSLQLETIVLVPGRSGENIANALGIPKKHIAITGNYIGYMLREAANKGFLKMIVMGHVGKIAKLSAGIFNTHSKVADARREVFVSHASLVGLPSSIIQQLWDAVTTEACVNILDQYDKNTNAKKGRNLLMNIAKEAEKRVKDYLKDKKVDDRDYLGIAFTDREGHLLAHSPNIEKLCQDEGWSLWGK